MAVVPISAIVFLAAQSLATSSEAKNKIASMGTGIGRYFICAATPMLVQHDDYKFFDAVSVIPRKW